MTPPLTLRARLEAKAKTITAQCARCMGRGIVVRTYDEYGIGDPKDVDCSCVWLVALLREAALALPVEAEGRVTGWQPSGREHELKTWPDYYSHLVDGTKTFEYRRDDRGFQVGDVLYLREWEPTFERYTGREMRRGVTYILNTSKEFVVMSLSSADTAPKAP